LHYEDILQTVQIIYFIVEYTFEKIQFVQVVKLSAGFLVSFGIYNLYKVSHAVDTTPPPVTPRS
jgi:hypothetical protein